jgi:nucleoside-diphosphate-sugar epimerase
MARPRALIVGVTGIVGNNLAQHLLDSCGWEVSGVSRNPPRGMSQVHVISADLQNHEATARALSGVKPTHVFFSTWSRQATEAENIRVNGAMLRNLLDAVGGSVRHASLMTGTAARSSAAPGSARFRPPHAPITPRRRPRR